MDHGDGGGDGDGDGDGLGDGGLLPRQGGEVMMMAVISPLSGASEQQDRTPFG